MLPHSSVVHDAHVMIDDWDNIDAGFNEVKHYRRKKIMCICLEHSCDIAPPAIKDGNLLLGQLCFAFVLLSTC